MVPALCAAIQTLLQVVLVVEHLLDLCPPHPRLLQLLLHTVQHHNTDQGWAAWLAPLLIRTCCNSKLSAPAWMWAALVDVVRGVSAGAAAEVAKQGLVTHPWSRRMWQLHFETAGRHLRCGSSQAGQFLVRRRTCLLLSRQLQAQPRKQLHKECFGKVLSLESSINLLIGPPWSAAHC